MTEETSKLINLSHNSIFFGPPGCGKSHFISKVLQNSGIKENGSNHFRIVFHPEYSHYDFVGSYRPVVGYKRGLKDAMEYNGVKSPEPITFYDFVPGPFANAIVEALKDSQKPVVLIIEELNRGNCAAIFGSIFQLLDRDSNNRSQYNILLPPEWDKWHKAQLGINNTDTTRLKIPNNLWILATMNTSDQSLFPLDAAFKRRWEMVYMSGDSGNNTVAIPYARKSLSWRDFRAKINPKIIKLTGNDDKQLGMWFFTPSQDANIQKSFASKVLGYLWDEIPNSQRSQIFADGIEHFGQLYDGYIAGKPVFRDGEDLAFELRPVEKQPTNTEAEIANAESNPPPVNPQDIQICDWDNSLPSKILIHSLKLKSNDGWIQIPLQYNSITHMITVLAERILKHILESDDKEELLAQFSNWGLTDRRLRIVSQSDIENIQNSRTYGNWKNIPCTDANIDLYIDTHTDNAANWRVIKKIITDFTDWGTHSFRIEYTIKPETNSDSPSEEQSEE